MIDALDKVFPDARYVMTHRDVADVIPSVVATVKPLAVRKSITLESEVQEGIDLQADALEGQAERRERERDRSSAISVRASGAAGRDDRDRRNPNSGAA